MTCGIYKITNKINEHSYIGLSRNIEKRIKEHFSHGINSKRKDDLDKPLYKAFKKYGIEKFAWEILEECPENQLKEREIYWINYYHTYDNRSDYNETPGGDMPGSNTVHLGESHGMAKLTEQDVIFCRQAYARGDRSRDIYNNFFSNKIGWAGFLRMWHGKNWKNVMPEVFNTNPHPSAYGYNDWCIIMERWHKSGLEWQDFAKTPQCYVGKTTLRNMIKNPDFYKNK